MLVLSFVKPAEYVLPKSNTRGSTTSSVRSARIREEQNVAELNAKLATLEMKQELAKARIQLELEEQQLELRTQLSIAEAKAKVLDQYDNDRSSQTSVSSKRASEQPQQPMRSLSPFGADRGPKQWGTPPLNHLAPVFHTLNCDAVSPAPVLHAQNNYDAVSSTPVLHAQNHDMVCPGPTLDGGIASVVREMKKPQIDLAKFSGDPLDYNRFIRHFSSKITQYTSNDEENLTFLEQFTTGEAHDIVVGYSYLSADVGYRAAMDELERYYGDNDVIAHAFIAKALNWPNMSPDKPKDLDRFAIFLNECHNAVKYVNGVNVLEDSANIKTLVKKLPYFLHDKWRNIVLNVREKKQAVSFEQLVSFVRREAKKQNDPVYGRTALSADTKGSASGPKPRAKGSFATVDNPAAETYSKNASTSSAGSRTPDRGSAGRRDGMSKPCLFCESSSHSMLTCRKFEALSNYDKTENLKKQSLCFGCLRYGHRKRECRGKMTCEKCQFRHPTILHFGSRDSPNTSSGSSSRAGAGGTRPAQANTGGSHMGAGVTRPPETNVVSSHTGTGGGATLAIIPVRLGTQNGTKTVETYAFLDPGSTVSFITEKLRQELNCQGQKKTLSVQTMGAVYPIETFAIGGLRVTDLSNQNSIDLPRAYTKDDLPVSASYIPTQEDIASWPHLQDVVLPDLDAEIGLMIGNNIPDAYAPLDVRTGPAGSPHAIKTKLGWVVWGVVRENSCESTFAVHNIVAREIESVEALETLVRDAINRDFPERVADERKENSIEDQRFLTHVNETIKFVDGHYCIDLPFKSDSVQLPGNRCQAADRMNHLKKKFIKSPAFHEDYKQFVEAMIDGGHAEIVPENAEAREGRVWYIPHHAVYHPAKPDKIRVVFDCAARYHGLALNDVLLQGPDLTNSLVGVLQRFREHKIALMGDIEKMFFQVSVPPQDRDCFRFLWWPGGDISKEPVAYRMKVYLFGAVSSPSCANVALRRVADDNRTDFSPEVLRCIARSFYVDDCLKSVDDVMEAISMVEGLTSLCSRGGFRLTKWVSNNRLVLESIPEPDRAKTVKNLNLDQLPSERALGVVWSPETDTFSVSINLKEKPASRRGILSIVSATFDPLGLVAPLVLPAKILLQRLCERKIGWDDEIEGNDLLVWQQWKDGLVKLSDFSVPRCYKPKDFGQVVSCQLHHFADASEVGYGTASYIRLVDTAGQIACSLIMGKARVTPLKKTSIPRLELTAATMAVRLHNTLIAEIDMAIDRVVFWTDSTTVLRYIRNETSRYHTFVANRVAVIRGSTEIDAWRYVDTKSNTADFASRGIKFDDGISIQRWLRGPEFLWSDEARWPADILDSELVTHEVDVEEKHDVAGKSSVVAASIAEPVSPLAALINYHSQWHKLRRAVGWLIEIADVLKRRAALRSEMSGQPADAVRKALAGVKRTVLRVVSLNKATEALVKHEQAASFPDEIECLSGAQPRAVKRTSPLHKFDIFLDEGVIRVGGRLGRARLQYGAKHPYVLPKCSRVSTMLVEETHASVGHLGTNSVLAALREEYWVLRASVLIQSVVRKCVRCRRYQAKPGEQKMADLPAERVTASEPPFSNTGVDYFGPFEIKRGRSVHKRYGVLFTCFASRAVHLELAQSLETDSCINAYRRFLARRGRINTMRSDNGSNLVGAKAELKAALKELDTQKIGNFLENEGIEWDFNPPACSHFGGVWERLIRSSRKVLYSILKEHPSRLDDEALHTLFCEVEAILNARPLTKVSSDPNDLEALTPNHLLTMRAGISCPPGVFVKQDLYVRKRWRAVQYLADLFWKRWVSEYLPALQLRQKWLSVRRNVQVGDIVLLVDNSLRSSWAMARVISSMPDSKGIVRFVKVATATNVLTRPIDKLVVLLECEEA